MKVMKDKKVYAVEWGYLLDKESVEYDKYSLVYGGKNAYYDENQYYTIDNLEDIKNNLLNCITKGVGNIYVVVTYQGTLDTFNLLEEEIDNMDLEELENYLNENCFDTAYISYDERDIVFSAYKNEDGEIILDFTKKEMK